MKILTCHRPGGAFGYISDGWVNALLSKGHQARRWDGNKESWDIFDPDLYIGCSGHRQDIPQNRRAKVAIHVNPYGPVDLKSINESNDSITWVLEQNPDAVFGYGDEEDRLLWSFWDEKHGITWIPMPTAADICIFNRDLDENKKTHDIVYLGGRWDYKAITMDSYLIHALKTLGKSFVVHGWGDWPQDICSGGIADDMAADFLNSGKIGPCSAEKHTHLYGIDVPERMFKVAACGTLVIHDSVPAVKRYIPSIVVAQNPDNFVDLCRHYIENDDERVQLIEKQKSEVLAAHTYHHRMHTMLSSLGFDDAATSMLG